MRARQPLTTALLLASSALVFAAYAQDASIVDDTSIVQAPVPAEEISAPPASTPDRHGEKEPSPTVDQAATPNQPAATDKAFPNKLIFSETPEIGYKWRGGFRNHDLLLWNAYFNFGNWVAIDWFFAGIPSLTLQDSTRIADNFGVFTIKSRPVDLTLGAGRFRAGGGVKFYWSTAEFLDSLGEGVEEQKDGSVNPFLATSIFLRDRHYFNISASCAIRTIDIGNGDTRKSLTWSIVPGYRIFIGKRKSWSFGLEYWMMNPEELPIKLLQYGMRDDNLDFYNPDQLWLSFMVYGFTYSKRRIRVDINLANHQSFTGPIVPFVGFGWNF